MQRKKHDAPQETGETFVLNEARQRFPILATVPWNSREVAVVVNEQTLRWCVAQTRPRASALAQKLSKTSSKNLSGKEVPQL